MKRISYICAALLAALCVSCGEKLTDPTIPVPDDASKPHNLDSPKVCIIDMSATGFTATWDIVTDAKDYEYVFDGEPAQTTQIPELVFSDLAANSEHTLIIKANPRPESGKLPSLEVTVNIVTTDILPLETPVLTIGTTYTSMTIVSWGAVQEAAAYECNLDGVADTVSNTFVTLQGLIEDHEYNLKVRALNKEGSYRSPSEWANVTFKPKSDGSEQIYPSSFAATSDGISFNVFANAGQYYWYDCITEVTHNKYVSHEAYVDSVKADIDARAEELIKKGFEKKEAYASILHSGSANVSLGACASLTYSLTIFSMDLDGNILKEYDRQVLTTPADLDSDGPSYSDEKGWFTQTMQLGTTASYPPTTYIGFTRKGTGVTECKYLLYTTDRFYSTYGKELTQDVLNRIMEKCSNDGSTSSDTAIEKINTEKGYSAGYSNREPGTSYTLVALATNSSGERSLAINSVRTRTTTNPNCWISLAYSRTTSSFKIKFILGDGVDATAGKLFCDVYSDVTSKYSRAEYRNLILTKGTALTDSEVASLNANGYVYVTVTGLTASTKYFIGMSVTNSTDDTTTYVASLTTN